MTFTDYVEIVKKSPFFEHDIFNVDGADPIDGFSIDLRTVENNYVLKNSLHFHKFLEIELVVSGSGIHRINGQNKEATKGYMTLTRQSDFHSWSVDESAPAVFYNIAFSENHISPWVASNIQKYDSVMDCVFTEKELSEILPLFDLLLSEFKAPTDDFKTMRKSLLNAILLYFMRRIPKDKKVKNEKPRHLLIQKVIHYLEQHFADNDISLGQVSDIMGVTPNYLGKLFKDSIGASFNEYLTERRLSHSLRLLNQNLLSIKQIAEKSGFSSSPYFISIFKKHFGTTPKQYLLNLSD